MLSHTLALVAITFAAAIINGALGYGFSSITVPLALLFMTNRALNPALVLIEVALNGYVLWVNRAAVARIRRRVSPVLLGLLPGVALGTLIVARVHPGWVKLATYVTLVPLILFQAAGFRRAIKAERAGGLALGSGIGLLYAVTTISGPPLALALNNQALSKDEFRAALGLVRLAESTLTAIAYAFAGFLISDSVTLVPLMVPSVAIGVPLGALIIRHVRAETFRRLSMSFDAWIVSFGLSTLVRQLHLVESSGAYLVMVAVVLIDARLLYRFFKPAASDRRRNSRPGPSAPNVPEPIPTPGDVAPNDRQPTRIDRAPSANVQRPRSDPLKAEAE
ncbi:MAG TPA: sulfite exporter TauE/SafE family protein [Vicinamibacterales bacterium]|nr:sulfite exporter TauE/SafE family protein [Vicinamibacterales bacterium]